MNIEIIHAYLIDFEMVEMAESNTDEDKQEGKSDASIEEKCLLENHDGDSKSNQVSEFTTIDERKCPTASTKGELCTY